MSGLLVQLTEHVTLFWGPVTDDHDVFGPSSSSSKPWTSEEEVYEWGLRPVA